MTRSAAAAPAVELAAVELAAGGLAAGGLGAAAAPAPFDVINYPTTPAGVGRRIPPNKDVAVRVTLAGLAPSTNAIISIAGAGVGGNATFDGSATKTMSASGKIGRASCRERV